jgi:hypothetical protein
MYVTRASEMPVMEYDAQARCPLWNMTCASDLKYKLLFSFPHFPTQYLVINMSNKKKNDVYHTLKKCLAGISNVMKNGSYMLIDKDNESLVLNDKVYNFDGILINNLTPRDVFHNVGFVTKVSESKHSVIIFIIKLFLLVQYL